MTKEEQLKQIDETWDPIIEAQRKMQGKRVMELIDAAAKAEDTIPYDELERDSRRD
jgi:hypothetical protein